MISYLNNRKHIVLFEDTKYSLSKIHAGVPQDSILSLLLFLIYINDLPILLIAHSNSLTRQQDDTTLYGNIEDFSSNNIENEINLKSQSLDSWFK